MKHAARSNWDKCFLVLFICTMVLVYGTGRLDGVNVVFQRPSELLRSPFSTSFCCCPLLEAIFC